MRILLALRLYSGLEACLETGSWRPSGAPTIYKLIEALDAQAHDYDLVLVAKGRTRWPGTRVETIAIKGLRRPITVVPGERLFPAWLGRHRWVVSEFWQTLVLAFMAAKRRPDVLYCDRATAWMAGIGARVLRFPTVLRVMGISPGLRQQLCSRSFTSVVTKWAYRSRFAAIICTLDGSNGSFWLGRSTAPGIPIMHWPNGCDVIRSGRPAGAAASPSSRQKTNVLFASRLETIKGCDEFLAAFLAARRRRPGALHATVVGDGERASALREAVSSAGADEDVTFAGEVPHTAVATFYADADIYVSLNRMGNFSNATLEAMTVGCCIILPMPDRNLIQDQIAEELLPPDTAFRVPNVADIAAIADAICHLHDFPEDRSARALRTAAVARERISPWERRIGDEVALLTRVSQFGRSTGG
jgi:glycosyltransferase involved in cell wall biosynthesis